MNNTNPSFEEEVRRSFVTPEIRKEFVDQVFAELQARAEVKIRRRPALWLRPAWGLALATLALAVAAVLVAGPQRVYAAMSRLLGFIPGVGIVDSSHPIRGLAAPVSVSQGDVSLSVTSATLTADRTHLEYRIFGVPGSAYPRSEEVVGCTQFPYLLLPDGTRLLQEGADFQPMPANVNEAVFVMPCISGTLPGKAPENWLVLLRFVAASPSLTVMPVIEVSPSPQASATSGATAVAQAVHTPTAAAQASPALSVKKVIQTDDGYIFLGAFQPQDQAGEMYQQSGELVIHDASGKPVSYSYPSDVDPDAGLPSGASGWAVQIKAAGLSYPLTFRLPGVKLLKADPNLSTSFSFDAGSDPQPGAELLAQHEILLGGHTLTLTSLSVDSRNGFSFLFHVDPQVYSVQVQIEGHAPNGGGGGGGGGLTDGEFGVSLSYASLPRGRLTAIVSNLVLVGDALTWETQWSPAVPRSDLPAHPTPRPGLCLAGDGVSQLAAPPVAFGAGKALLYEELQPGEWGLALYGLDGKRLRVIAPQGNWGALSADGGQAAYSGSDGKIHVTDTVTGEDRVLTGAQGYNITWSPDGKQLAYISTGGAEVSTLFVTGVDGADVRQVSNLSYASVAGWSADGRQLYFAVPFTGGAAWKMYVYDFAQGAAQELFTIENGTPKFLNPRLSPDGQWIAYRGKDNSSIYLVHADGSNVHLALESINGGGMEWSASGWLAVSRMQNDGSQGQVVILKPESCQAYLLPAALHGEVEGMYLP